MIYPRGEAPVGTRFKVFQCSKCGWSTEIAEFLRNPEVICCGEPMQEIAKGIQVKDHLQLLLFE